MDVGRKDLVGKRKKKVDKCPNPLFAEWLTEWKDDAAQKALKSQYTYAKALNSLKKYPVRLTSGKECKMLENFGDKICKMLDDRLSKHIEEYGPPEPVSYHYDKDTITKTKRSKSCTDAYVAHDEDSDVRNLFIPPPLGGAPVQGRKRAKSGGDRVKEYLPKPGSGGYALIVTLYQNLEQPTSRGYMMKAELMEEAQPLADKSFDIPDPGCRYTAWSSMGTLIKKGYVIKEKSPARYSITNAGCELAHKLLEGDPINQEGGQDVAQAAAAIDGHCVRRAATPPVKRTYSHDISDSSDEESGLPYVAEPSTHNAVNNACQGIPPFTEPQAEVCRYWYVNETNDEVKKKDEAHVLIDDEISIGFLIKIKYEDLLLSGKRYKIDNSRLAEDDFVYAYLHNDDAEEISPGHLHKADNRQVPNMDIDEPMEFASLKDRLPSMSSLLNTRTGSTSDRYTGKDASETRTITGKDVSKTRTIKSCENVIQNSSPSVCRTETQNIQVNYKCQTSEPVQKTNRNQRKPIKTVKDLPEPKFTLKPGSFELILCVDNREFFGGSLSSKTLVPELQKNCVKCELRKLEVGDFLWIGREKSFSSFGKSTDAVRELVLDYVIERKRMDDLASSITDGRFREQKFRMKNCGLRKPAYLVEDYGSAQHFSIPEATLMQAITNTQVIDGFYVKRTHDTRESAAYLTVMTRYLQSYYRDKTLCGYSRDELVGLNDLDISNSTVALMTFKEFNDTTGKTKAITVKEMFAKQLLQIHGLTAEKAFGILDVFPTPAVLIEAYDSCASVKQKEEMLTQIKYGPLKRNIGKLLSKQLYQLYCTDGPMQ